MTSHPQTAADMTDEQRTRVDAILAGVGTVDDVIFAGLLPNLTAATRREYVHNVDASLQWAARYATMDAATFRAMHEHQSRGYADDVLEQRADEMSGKWTGRARHEAYQAVLADEAARA